MENYSGVVLTEQETDEALRNARKEKHFRLERLAYHEKISKPIEYKQLTTEEVFNSAKEIMRKLVDNFVIDEPVLEIFELLSLYFSGNEEFETYGYSLKKGIMLLGPLGCGKTSIMKSFAVNSYNAFAFNTCRKVCDNYAQTKKNTDEQTGYDAITEFSSLIPVYPQYYYGQNLIGCCFDDLGTETVRKNFGNEANVMAEVILNRYEKPELRNKTHFTGNLTAEQIGEFYGDRVKSRLREMCNMITFSPDAKDRRV